MKKQTLGWGFTAAIMICCLSGEAHANSSCFSFVDNEVRHYAFENWDLDGNQCLTQEEIAAVTEISEHAFANNSRLKSVEDFAKFPNLRIIRSGAFANTNISQIHLPNIVEINSKTDESGAFENCLHLTRVELSGLKKLGANTFSGCRSLNQVKLPSTTHVNARAFELCTRLTGINLPAATYVESYAFAGCTNLASVELSKVSEISTRAFYGCASLTNIVAPTVQTVGEYAFGGCVRLASVSFPQATTIGDYAFETCTSLASVNLPKVEVLNNGAFMGCSSLVNIRLENLTTLGNSAFYGCGRLQSVEFPKLRKVENAAFVECYELFRVSFPSLNELANAFDASTCDISLTSSGNIQLASDAFDNVNTEYCSLTIHEDKVPGGGGSPSLYNTQWAGKTWNTLNIINQFGEIRATNRLRETFQKTNSHKDDKSFNENSRTDSQSSIQHYSYTEPMEDFELEKKGDRNNTSKHHDRELQKQNARQILEDYNAEERHASNHKQNSNSQGSTQNNHEAIKAQKEENSRALKAFVNFMANLNQIAYSSENCGTIGGNLTKFLNDYEGAFIEASKIVIKIDANDPEAKAAAQSVAKYSTSLNSKLKSCSWNIYVTQFTQRYEKLLKSISSN